MSSFKSCKNIDKKEGGPESTDSNNQDSSETLNTLAMNTRERERERERERVRTIISSFREAVNPEIDVNPKRVKKHKTV